MKKLLSIFILVCFLVTSVMGPDPVYAQNYVLPAPGTMVNLSPAFNPPILKGIKIHPDNPFRFDFILDQGDNLNVPGPLSSRDQVRSEATKLIKYFLVSLTIPEKDLWVNLSPYEKDRIIPQSFGLTEMGRDLLAEDYMLKQITASLIYPEGMTGRKFWKRIYEEASRKFGTTNIPVNTFNKVWIIPEKAVVYENAKAGTAYVVESRLKVMLEQDYLSMQKHMVVRNDMASVGANIVREVVIPELTKEINEDKNFAQLRQVYNSLILATWYKKKIRDGILAQVYADKKKIAGVGYKNSINIETIYQRYLQAFKKGVYNYIKEEQDPLTQEITPRKYFSGGARFNMEIAYHETSDPGMLSRFVSDQAMIVSAGISPITHSNGKVLVTGFTSESARAVKVADIIKKINQLIAGEEKFFPALNGDEINLIIKIKHLVKSLPQDEQEKAKWLDDVHFMMGERYIFSGKAIRSILWYVPSEGKYVSILLAPNLDVTKGLITELFSILHGDEFDADFTSIDSIEHTKTFDDARWDTWSYESTGAKRAYKENIHPAVFKAVLSLIEHQINESPLGAPVKIKMADIYGGDGSFLEMFHKSLKAYCETVNLRMPEMEYWLVERNANNIEAAKTILSQMTVHIIKADLTKEALQDLLPPMDIITSIGGGFNSPVASRQDARKLSEAVSKTLAKEGRVIVTGYSVSALKVSEFEGLKPINLSIPVNFINGTYPYQMYVFEKANKDGAMVSLAQGITINQVDGHFKDWVISGLMAAEDGMLLNKILSGDEDQFKVLLSKYSKKIFIKKEDRENPEEDGRSVYLRLEKPFPTADGDITILRIKGARPRASPNDSKSLSSYTGRGFVSKVLDVDEEGNWFARPVEKLSSAANANLLLFTPTGTMLLERANREYQLMQLGTQRKGFETDYPIAVGLWNDKTHAGRPTGFVIAGMHSEDVRISVQYKAYDLDIKKQIYKSLMGKRLKYVLDTNNILRDVITNKKVPTDLNMSKQIYKMIGRSLRAYHDAGYFHRYPHAMNLGVEIGDNKNVKLILRDLDTTITRQDMKGDLGRVETAYRLVDLQRVIGDLSHFWTLAERATVKPLIEALLEGYFYEIAPGTPEFNRILEQSVSKELAEAAYLGESPQDKLVLNENTPFYGDVWKHLYDVAIANSPNEKVDAAMFATTQRLRIRGLREDSINALIKANGPQMLNELEKRIENTEPAEGVATIEILSERPDRIRFLRIFLMGLKSKSRFVRLTSVKAAEKVNDSRANEILMRAVNDPDTRISMEALNALEKMGTEENIPELLRVAQDLPEEELFYIYDDHGATVAYTKPSDEKNRTTDRLVLKGSETVPNFLKEKILEVIFSIKNRWIELRKSKRIEISGVEDQLFKDFMGWLKENNFEDILVFGGGVRDALIGKQSSDFDITVAVPLTEEEYIQSLSTRAQANKRIVLYIHKRLEALAQALGVPVEDFFDPAKQVLWRGREIQYSGPIEKKDAEGQPVYIKRALVDSNSLGLFSSSSGPSILQMAVDVNGQLYGHVEAINDLSDQMIRIIGNLKDLNIGMVMRIVRLQCELGLQLTADDELSIRGIVKEYIAKRLYEKDPYLKEVVIIKQLNSIVKIVREKRSLIDPLSRLEELGMAELIQDHLHIDLKQFFAGNRQVASESEKGGIDLTAANMNLQTKVMDSRFDNGIQFHLDPAMLQQLQNAQGFVPVIINIQPMASLKMFLGAVNN